jgi:anti-anti-sigma regulatory factor
MDRFAEWREMLTGVHYQYANEAEQQKARGILGMTWGIAIGTLIAVAVQFILYPDDATKFKIAYAAIGTLGALCFLTLPYELNHGRITRASIIMVSVLFLIALFAFLPNTFNSFLMSAFVLPLVAGGVLFGRRGLAMVVTIISETLILLWYLNDSGRIDGIMSGNPNIMDALINGIIIFSVGGIIIDVFAGRQQALLQGNIRLTDDLQESLQTIHEAEANRIQADAERQRLLEERARLQEEIIDGQREALKDLSTPIIPLLEGIIVMPLVGNIDSLRAQDIMRSLLAGIGTHNAAVAILDITGVVIVDTNVASHLSKTLQAAQLKGTHTIITGVSNAVAETIVDLGIDWSNIQVMRDLQSGLTAALKIQGREIV